MLQEAPQELGGRERHLSLLVAARVILPAEGDALTVESQQAMIADGDTVSVPAEVAQHLASAAESWLGINDPVLPEQRAEKSQKQLGLFERRVGRRELQFLVAERPLEAAHELATKHLAEDLHGQEEPVLGMHPAGTIRGQTAGRDDTVNEGMQQSSRTIP